MSQRIWILRIKAVLRRSAAFCYCADGDEIPFFGGNLLEMRRCRAYNRPNYNKQGSDTLEVVLQNLTKKFPARGKGNKGEVTAVDNFTFTIEDGELIGLLGPSGCGKSTTLHLLSGLQTPTAGRIFFGDDDVTELPAEHRGVGLVFQSYALYPHLTVAQNIRFPLENLKGKNKLSKEEMAQRVLEAARLVQIDGLLERKPNELSGGQQQRVAIAHALVKAPRILLLDEPLSNLDARLRLQTREELRRIQPATGVTTVFVTHDQDEAMSISDRIVVMKDGRVHQIGAPQKVYDDPCNLFVATFLGTPPIHVFDAEVKEAQLHIGGQAVLKTPGIADGKVTAAIRPEGFDLEEEGLLTCRLHRVVVMGRDISVVCDHDDCQAPVIRAIISAENEVDTRKDTVRFNLKPEKVFLFDPQTGERLRFSLD